ncbi:Ubiquitin-conjugating enzyme E2 22, partial [Tetrabaena socialis]
IIRCLLIQPFPDSALNEEAGKLLLEDYDEYDKRARLMTSIHALGLAKRPTPLTTSGANAGGSGSEGAKKEGGAGEGSSPTLKKAKSEQPKAGPASSTMAKVKKGLKRL